jgi:large subunit ribosomal protein L10
MNKKFNPQKTSVLAELKDLLSQSKSVAIVDYKGLKVSQATQLRRDVKKAGGQVLVTKNTLFKLATGISELNLEGTSAFVFSLNDEISAIKAVADFAKKNQLPTFKLGLLNNTVLSSQQISDLATLPDKPTLVSKLLGTINAPLFRLAYNLNWSISKLVRTLDAVAKSKEVN